MDVYGHLIHDAEKAATEKLAALVLGGSKTVATQDAVSQKSAASTRVNGGWGRNRTGVHGFAVSQKTKQEDPS